MSELSYRERLGHQKYDDPGIDCSKDEPITQQQFKDECDINMILKKYERGGVVHVNSLQAAYGDFSNVTDFQDALNRVNAAHLAFMELPAAIRKEFKNDPSNLLQFLSDPKNRDRAIELGLVEKPQGEKPQGEQVERPPA